MILLLTAGISLGVVTNAQAATPKPGTTCLKLGFKQISNGKQFTCIKSGKKLVWDKGIVIKKASSTNTPTPEATSIQPTSTPSLTPTPQNQVTPSQTPAPTTPALVLNKIEVAKHNNASDCWSIIDGNVYNLTSWISQHPGGQAAIKSLCGIDGSVDFHAQHRTQAKPARELKAFLLGIFLN